MILMLFSEGVISGKLKIYMKTFYFKFSVSF